ncbi:hypothetical protein BDN70DRAFT_341747 [Pholiota conissans]|uniref:Uncharacterized protein n=1 Tax=Pholiota conissans TaxID=109636 RepID=A0A9P5Z9Q6_9AGAR|nr:hypothetical protein BDN70DRAFT_341747 [Pholiota conissans]
MNSLDVFRLVQINQPHDICQISKCGESKSHRTLHPGDIGHACSWCKCSTLFMSVLSGASATFSVNVVFIFASERTPFLRKFWSLPETYILLHFHSWRG